MAKVDVEGAARLPVSTIPYDLGLWNYTFDGGLPVIHYGETGRASRRGKRNSRIGS